MADSGFSCADCSDCRIFAGGRWTADSKLALELDLGSCNLRAAGLALAVSAMDPACDRPS